MSGLASLPFRVSLVAGLLLVAGTNSALAQQRVGVHSAVNPEAAGAPPGAPARRLVIGQDVIFNERITTGPAGQTQLLFLDESAMTVGPNSDVTIDQFVYDPKSGTGKLAMSATRGLLRYVGGKLSKQDQAVTVRTNTATLAVRGGAFLLDFERNGETQVIFVFGDGLTLTGLNGIVATLRRPGFQITISAAGAFSPATAIPVGRLAQLIARLDGRPGGTGGARVIPTDAAVIGSGVPQTVSGNLPASLQQAAANQGAVQGTPQNFISGTTNQTIVQQLNSVTNPIGGGSQAASTAGPYAGVSKAGAGFFGPDQTSSANVPFPSGALNNGTFSAKVGSDTLTFPLAAGTTNFSPTGSSPGGAVSGSSFLSDDGSYFFANLNAANGQAFFVSGGLAAPASALAATGATRVFAFDLSQAPSPSSIPFSPQEDFTFPKPSVSPLFMVAPASTAIGDASGGTRTLQASLAFSGQGSAQNSTLVMHTGTVGTLQSSGAPIVTGVMRGVETDTGLIGPPSERISSAVSSVVDGNGNSLYGTNNAITGFTLDHTQFAPGANGAVGGPLPSQGTETEGAASSGGADTFGFAQPAVATRLPAGVGTARTTQTLSGFFGGMMQSSANPRNYPITGAATVATDSAANTVKATFTSDPTVTTVLPAMLPTSTSTSGVITMNFGGQQSAFIDNNIFGAAEDPAIPQQVDGKPLVVNGDPKQASHLYFVSSGTTALPTSLLPSGVSYCDCQFLQWGYWGGDLITGSSGSSISRIDQGHINSWVAGVPTPLGDLSTLASQSATANYTGHAFGSVLNNGANYVAVGGFNGTYNFGTQVGSVTVNNFDGHSFTASGKAPLNGSNYTFTASGSGASATFNGGFFGPKAAETGGNFVAQAGSTYTASGIYAGKQ